MVCNAIGTQNSPAVFTHMMRKLLAPLHNKPVLNFMDDLIIATESFKEHKELLGEVLSRLRQTGLSARPTKCFMGFEALDYLGHTVSHTKLRPDSSKVEQLCKCERPKTKSEVQFFLGLVNYRKFVPSFSAIASPLTDLTENKAPDKVIWTELCESAFQALKVHLNCAIFVLL